MVLLYYKVGDYMDLREVTEFLKDFAGYIVTFLIIVFVVSFIVSPHPVAGNSMTPTLEEGQVVLVLKFSKNYQRNEIVVLNNHKKSYIKRIIGLPGERIDYINDILYIDNVPYKETFLDENIKTSSFLFEDVCSINLCPGKVIPDDMYLVLGDNRPESVDSRDNNFGLVSKKDIKGKVLFRIWPIPNFGKVN